jgi:hypothetical protein
LLIYFSIYDFLVILDQILFGLMLVLLGLFFVLYKKYLSNIRLWMATGAAYITVGAFSLAATTMVSIMILGHVSVLEPAYYLWVSLFITTQILTIVAAVMGAFCFFGAKRLSKG